MIRNILFDMDDTLLQCSGHYEDAKKEFVKIASERTGYDEMYIRAILNAIDSTNGQLHHFTKERWPLSFAATSATLDAMNDNEVDREATKQAYDIGNKVFDCAYLPIPGALETLDKYHKAGFNLILYTKGDLGVQRKKIANNGLWKYFTGANTYIVNKKDGDAVRRIINEQYILPVETCVVGDNFREDVQSALDAKIMAVHINPSLNTAGKKFRLMLMDDTIIDCLDSIVDLPLIIPPKSVFANV